MRDIRFLLKAHYSESYALIIGINNYKNASPLTYAVSDAKGVRDALIDELGFPASNVTSLMDGDATKNRILQSYMRYTRDDIDIDSRIIVFFAGHGHTRTGVRGEIGYLVPQDANINDFSTFIRWDELTRNSELIRAKHMLFVMDACYSGLALTRNANAGSVRFVKDMMLRYSRQVVTAGKADEVVADSGGPIPDHSVFTGHLLEAIHGKAISDGGVLTASGLMAYVYGKVAGDKNSRQTPHYGYFDGDGDFILKLPKLGGEEDDGEMVADRLISVPSVEDFVLEDTLAKIKRVKVLLASPASAIELHDYIVGEIRRFLATTGDDDFKVQGAFSGAEFIERLARYESRASDIALLSACIARWRLPESSDVLPKLLVRSTDRLDVQSGLPIWLELRWYPLILILYSAGIAAVEGKKYDVLADIFYTRVLTERRGKQEFFAESISRGILELVRSEAFKGLPGHERHYVPLSEHLFKILQPMLDDVLFLGKDYESAFDEFEVLFALVVVDLNMQSEHTAWGPVGRFGWKARDGGPLNQIAEQGKAAGESWPPLRAGLFGGSYARFVAAADAYRRMIAELHWW